MSGRRLGDAVEFRGSEGIDITRPGIQFSVHHPGIATSLAGIASPKNLARNVDAIELTIDFEAMARVPGVLKPIHNHDDTRGLPNNRETPLPAN